MLKIADGQCGMCAHFGEHDPDQTKLVQIRVKGEAPEELVEPCGHPKHAPLNLNVTANSTCEGYIPARKAG